MAVRVRLGQGPSVTDEDHDPSHPNGDLRAVGPTDRCEHTYRSLLWPKDYSLELVSPAPASNWSVVGFALIYQG